MILTRYNFKTILYFFTILVVHSCASSKRISEPKNEEELTQEITRIASQSQLAGVGVAIVHKGNVVYQKGFGYQNVETQMPYTIQSTQSIASISKTFIALAIMKAIELDKISLNEDINTYLPFSIRNPNFPNEKITLNQLASHTSSIIDGAHYIKSYYFKDAESINFNPYKSITKKEAKEVVKNKLIDDSEYLFNTLSKDGKWNDQSAFSNKKPGDETIYSNTGAALAAYVVENAVGMPYEDFVKKYVFEPLSMRNSNWEFTKVSADQLATKYETKSKSIPHYNLITKADGSIYTNIEDLTKYLLEIRRGFLGKGSLVSNESYKRIFAKASKDDEQCLFWDYSDDGVLNHSGGDPGTTTNLVFVPRVDKGLILFTNTSVAWYKGNQKAIQEIWQLMAKYKWE